MLPNVASAETAMKLALLGTLRDDLVGEDVIADFLLYTLNKQQQFQYVQCFGLPGPSDDIDEVLHAVAKRIGALGKGGVADTHRAAKHMLMKYRAGQLGCFRLVHNHSFGVLVSAHLFARCVMDGSPLRCHRTQSLNG
jgi:ribosome biogenesis GTPase A